MFRLLWAVAGLSVSIDVLPSNVHGGQDAGAPGGGCSSGLRCHAAGRISESSTARWQGETWQTFTDVIVMHQLLGSSKDCDLCGEARPHNF